MGRTLGARQKRQNYSIPWVASVGDLIKNTKSTEHMEERQKSYFVFKKSM
jgi:hypothetical protein